MDLDCKRKMMDRFRSEILPDENSVCCLQDSGFLYEETREPFHLLRLNNLLQTLKKSTRSIKGNLYNQINFCY